jgi:acyl-CoA thioesterase FadM
MSSVAPTPYIIEEYVRWSDVDFAGIIFSLLRALLRDCGDGDVPLVRPRVQGRLQPVRHLSPRKAVHQFYHPPRLDDRLRVATYVGKVGTTSMTLNFDVLRDGPPTLAAAGWMVLVCVDRAALRPRPLPAELLVALAPHTLGVATARAALGVPGS